MPRTAPPRSIELLLPSPTPSTSTAPAAPSRRVLKLAETLAKRKRKVLDVASLSPESSGSRRRSGGPKRQLKPGRGGTKDMPDGEQAGAEQKKEQADRERSEGSSGYWNHLLIEARRSRGPQWDFNTQTYHVDRDSHFYYSQAHLPERPVAAHQPVASTSALAQAPQPYRTQAPQAAAPPPQQQRYPSQANFAPGLPQHLGANPHELQAQQQALIQQRQALAQQQQQPGPQANFSNMSPEQVALYRQQFLQHQQQMAMQMNGARSQGQPVPSGQPQAFYSPQPGSSIYTSQPLRAQQQQQGMRPGGMSGMMLGGQQWQGQAR